MKIEKIDKQGIRFGFRTNAGAAAFNIVCAGISAIGVGIGAWSTVTLFQHLGKYIDQAHVNLSSIKLKGAK